MCDEEEAELHSQIEAAKKEQQPFTRSLAEGGDGLPRPVFLPASPRRVSISGLVSSNVRFKGLLLHTTTAHNTRETKRMPISTY